MALKTTVALGVAGTMAVAVLSTTVNDGPPGGPSDVTAQGPKSDAPAGNGTGTAPEAEAKEKAAEDAEATPSHLSPTASAEPEPEPVTEGTHDGARAGDSPAHAGGPETAAPLSTPPEPAAEGDDGPAGRTESARPSSPEPAPGQESPTAGDGQQDEEPSPGDGGDGLVDEVVDEVGGTVGGVTGSLGLGG